MKGSKKVITAVLCAALACPFATAFGTMNASAATKDTPYNITVGIGANDSEARFCWQSESSAAGKLEIAKTSEVKGNVFPQGSEKSATANKVTATEGYLDNSAATDNPVSSYKDAEGTALSDEYSNKVTVQGLKAGESYTYRVNNGSEWSKTYTFTPQSTEKGFSFAAFGDPQLGASGDLEKDTAGWSSTLKKVYSKYPSLNFLFSMGDEVNDYDHLYTQQKEYKSFFNPDSTTDFLQTHMLSAYSGNHDFQMGKYFSYHYNLPNLSTLGQTITNKVPDNNGDYYFKYGNTLFMVLEGNNFYDVAAHDTFMNNAIEANKDAKWKVVSFHQAPYSEANHDGASTSDDDTSFMRKNWTKLMDKYAVDIVLNGHDHYYTRTYQMFGGAPVSTEKTNSVTNPKGTVYLTLDSASGSKYYKYNTTADHSFSAFGWQNKQPTYTYAKVTDNSFSLETYTTDSDTKIDTYTINKTSTAVKKNSPTITSSNTTTNSKVTTSSKTEENPKTGDDLILTRVLAIAGALVLITLGVVLKRKISKKANI